MLHGELLCSAASAAGTPLLPSQQKHLTVVRVNSAGWRRISRAGEQQHAVFHVVCWLWKPRAIVVSLVANRPCQAFLKLFLNVGKRCLLLRRRPDGGLSKPLEAGEPPVLHFAGQGRSSKRSSRALELLAGALPGCRSS